MSSKQSTDELVEAVARALYEQTGGWIERAIPWDGADINERLKWCARARAALAAVAKAAGMDSVALGFVASDVEAFGHRYDVQTAALLRALAGAADG